MNKFKSILSEVFMVLGVLEMAAGVIGFFIALRQANDTQFTLSRVFVIPPVVWLVAGFISGLLFIAISEVLDLLQGIYENTKNQVHR